ncbi:hypothetical protein Tco_0619518 [Tanacetum coccineum]
MGCYFYFPPENKIVVARYVEFFEKNLITQEVSGRSEGLEEIQDGRTSLLKITSVIPIEWIDAMNAEMQSMMDNMVWVLIDLPPGCKTVGNRLDLNKTQGASTPEEVKRMQNVPYASAVGSIMYAVRCTRPDVAFAQNITSRFQQNPGEPHWTAVKTILKYLRNTKDMFLVYGGNPEAKLRVECYCDAGFETDIDDIKSQT